MAEPQYSNYPNLHLSQDVFTISNPSSSAAQQKTSLESLQKAIKDQKMAPLYKHLAHPTEGILNPSGEGSSQHTGGLKRSSSGGSSLLAAKQSTQKVDLAWDQSLYDQLQSENEKELETIQKEEEEAIEKAGDTEIQAARVKRAEFWARVGDKVGHSPTLPLKTHINIRLLGQSPGSV